MVPGFVYRGDRLADLLHACELLTARRRDLHRGLGRVACHLDLGMGAIDGHPSFLLARFDGLTALLRRADCHVAGLLDLAENGPHLSDSLLGLLGEALDFLGDHGEAFALLAGLGRFDRRVHGKQVRLLGEVVHGGDDVPDRGGLIVQAVDRFGHHFHVGLDPLEGGVVLLRRCLAELRAIDDGLGEFRGLGGLFLGQQCRLLDFLDGGRRLVGRCRRLGRRGRDLGGDR